MLKHLKKDWFLMGRINYVIIFYSFVSGIVAQIVEPLVGIAIIILTSFITLYIYSSVGSRSYKNWQSENMFLHSLPLRRADIVKARYVSAAFFGLFYIVVMLLGALSAYPLSEQNLIFTPFLLLLTWSLSLIYNFIFLPLEFLNPSVAAYGKWGAYLLLFLLPKAVKEFFTRESITNTEIWQKISDFLEAYLFITVFLLGIVLLFFISYRISISTYQKHNF